MVFLASVFDEEAADAMDPLMPAFKIASGDLTHLPLLRHVAGKGKSLILSTGMATVEEIGDALEVVPRDQVVLLHCVSRYPTPPEEVGLRTIPFLAGRFGVPVGYSDHTTGTTACLAAVAIGAVLIEKHFTLDRNQPIGDHKLSAEPAEMAAMVARIREVERMLGEYGKAVSESEVAMRVPLRRSLYARRDIPAGTRLSTGDVIVMRPGKGLPPKALDGLVGRVTRRAIRSETAIQEEDF
jgi:sialic acid synthase SpsE